MSYDTAEKSREGGTPVECYRFSAGATVYRWTSADRAISLDIPPDGPMNYVPEAIMSDHADYSNEDHTGTINVNVTRLNPIGQMFLAYSPPEPVSLSIYRTHLDDGEVVLVFSGKVATATFNGAEIALVCMPMTAVFGRNVPRLLFQRECNRALYGPGCGVNKEAFKDTAIVTSIAGRVITADVFGTRPDGWYEGGWAETVDGTKRMVTRSASGSITLQSPFFGLAGGATLYVFAGCDRSEATCLAKFNNLANHLGFARIPTRNPFDLGMA